MEVESVRVYKKRYYVRLQLMKQIHLSLLIVCSIFLVPGLSGLSTHTSILPQLASGALPAVTIRM
jgi:hypothetical protein